MSKKYSKDVLIELYTQMLQIRRFEEKAGQLYGMGMIGGFCHLYIGQEAIAVGMSKVKKDGDSAITSYRDHGLMISQGSDIKSIFAELMGKSEGCSKGKGGSMHMFDTEKHFYGGHGIVGASVPLGTGIAFSYKYRNKKNVSMVYFGDGAANQGQIYESFNMAALWKLPVLYIIENNKYAMGTSIERSSASTALYARGKSFNIEGKRVNGMDIFEVMEEGEKALNFIREGNGPFILEMMTYRYKGHSMSDPAKYRSKKEVENVKETMDPIDSLKSYILKESFSTEEDLKAIDKSIKNSVAAIAEECKNMAEPDPCELWTDIY